MKKIFNYLTIFILTIIILFFALVVSSKIPHSAVEDNIKESAEFYKKKGGIHRTKDGKIYSYIHYYADMRKLNIIYCIDNENTIESTLWSKYYQRIKMDSNRDFLDLVENSREPNTNYLRYWNGCMLFLRPLLTIFNMEQIYLINKILLSTLSILLFIILFKKSRKIACIFFIALILVASWYVGFCIEYSVMYYIMFIASMIVIKIDGNNLSEDKKDEKLFKIFLITGIVTTFFDFLTTEILTIFIPLIFILTIRKEENRLSNPKDIFKFVIKSCILWFIGYAGMWLSKWVLSTLILHINAFDYVKDELTKRVNGLQELSNYETLYKNVIGRNLYTIPLMYLIKTYFYKWQTKLLVIIVSLLILTFINWKELKNKKYLLVFVFISIMPYTRYLILANHSFRHTMFTFRDQIITIMVLLYIIIDCFNYKLMSKNVDFKNILKAKRKQRETKLEAIK